MVRVLAVLIGVLAVSGSPQVAAAQTPERAVPASADSVRAGLDRFCVRGMLPTVLRKIVLRLQPGSAGMCRPTTA